MRIKRFIAVFFLVLTCLVGSVFPNLEFYSYQDIDKVPFQHNHPESESNNHHEFVFHIGIFHLLVHFYQDFLLFAIDNCNEVFLNYHLIVIENDINKRTFEPEIFTNAYFEKINYGYIEGQLIKNLFIYIVDNSKFQLFNQPSRAPPFISSFYGI